MTTVMIVGAILAFLVVTGVLVVLLFVGANTKIMDDELNRDDAGYDVFDVEKEDMDD